MQVDLSGAPFLCKPDDNMRNEEGHVSGTRLCAALNKKYKEFAMRNKEGQLAFYSVEYQTEKIDGANLPAVIGPKAVPSQKTHLKVMAPQPEEQPARSLPQKTHLKTPKRKIDEKQE
jgi:hypothetical protein